MTAVPLDVHRVPREPLRVMAAGDTTDADLHLLRSAQRSQLPLTLWALLDRVGEAGRHSRYLGGAAAAQEAWRLLCAIQQDVPEAVETVLGDPTVMAWALRLLRRLGGAAGPQPPAAPLWADLGQFQSPAAAAAVRAQVPAVLRVPVHRGMVWVHGAGVAGPVARRRWSEAEVRVERGGALVVRGARRGAAARRPHGALADPARVRRTVLRFRRCSCGTHEPMCA
ncbi:hypothetical protein [Streptomyces sp. NPDC058424]|uniref:hypothetical protein n=1 Tax=Streptomyces sp. NPDC058424 TaxID=3346491 RepID=UPI0036536886